MQNLYEPGRNCWRVERADHVSILVDYGNYYRDLRESIIRAEKSIFILGWDIDSRIELVRGEDAEKDEYPNNLFELLCWKAGAVPSIRIYLNKWDYSVFFLRQREPFWDHKWSECDHENIFHCLDDVLPLGACHHQKIAVIDDETAYWGGMDVALGRWDFREHHIDNDERADPGQLPHPGRKEHFSPYHDIMAVMSGPAATSLAEWARTRWKAACHGTELLPLAPKEYDGVPKTWPRTDPPDFVNVDVALARTLPRMKWTRQVEEIYPLMLDEIATAEQFIYIENQFLAEPTIAAALNKRLRECPNLRLLAISCHDPKGIMEKKSMWMGRLKFKNILERGGVGNRVALAYPTSCEDGKTDTVRIHSKLMIVDDKILRIGSANINRRSMGMDTEMDVSIIGGDDASRNKIAAVRNDLIREHTGYEHADIQHLVETGGDVRSLLVPRESSRQHLKEINDEEFRSPFLCGLATFIADPRRPFIGARFTRFPRVLRGQHTKARTVWIKVAITLLIVGLLAAISLLWSHTPLAEYASEEKLSQLMKDVKDSPIAFLWVIAIYTGLGLLFFPVTVISAAVILVFGGLKGLALSLAGALVSGLAGYGIGRLVGRERLEKAFPKSKTITGKLNDSGIIGVAVIRTLPIAPFSLMNLAFGVTGVSLLSFAAGTFFGLLPGKIMLAFFGGSLSKVFENPTPENIGIALACLAGWISVVFLCNKLAKAWQAKHGKNNKTA